MRRRVMGLARPFFCALRGDFVLEAVVFPEIGFLTLDGEDLAFFVGDFFLETACFMVDFLVWDERLVRFVADEVEAFF